MKILFSLLFLISTISLSAQNRTQVVKDIDTLSSDNFAGRGYVNDGDQKAAEYIAARFKELELKNFNNNYFQSLKFMVNSFPGVVELKVENEILKTGEDYILHPGCPSIKAELTVFNIDGKTIGDKKDYKSVYKQAKKLKNWALVYTPKSFEDEASKTAIKKLIDETNPNAIIELTEGELVWWVSMSQESIPKVILLKDKFPFDATTVSLNVEATFTRHTTQNVIGYVEGTEHPDSFIVITAHYDHLGMMGSETIFPGANDNASGTAMMMDFAKYYSEHPPKYSICFMAFCGEEAGLLGSLYYTKYPLFPLKQISFLVNMDLMGSGEDGIMAVNGLVFKEEWNMLDSINTEHEYLTKVAARPKAANSDHYYFTEKGVKAFFFYLMGPYSNYHDVADRADVLPLALYDESFKLIRDFMDALQNRY